MEILFTNKIIIFATVLFTNFYTFSGGSFAKDVQK